MVDEVCCLFQLYDTNPRVANEAADVLDEACEDEVLMMIKTV